MSFNSFEFSLLRAKRHADRVKQRSIVHEVRHRNDSERTKIQSSKIGLWLLFADAFFVQIFCMTIIYKYANESNVSGMIGGLLSLLATIFVQGLSYAVYSKKATAENTKNGIVYETALMEITNAMNTASSQDTEQNNMATDDLEDDAVG